MGQEEGKRGLPVLPPLQHLPHVLLCQLNSLRRSEETHWGQLDVKWGKGIWVLNGIRST